MIYDVKSERYREFVFTSTREMWNEPDVVDWD